MDHENRDSNDSLFENVGVVTALGVAGKVGATSFFRNKGGAAFDSALIKSKLYFQELSSNFEDLETIFNKRHQIKQNVEAKYAKYKNNSLGFRAEKTFWADRLMNLYAIRTGSNNLLRDIYQADIIKEGLKILDKYDVTGDIKSVIEDNINFISNNLKNKTGISNQLAKRLSQDKYNQAWIIAEDMISGFEEWTRNNPFEGTWGREVGSKIISDAENIMGDVYEMLEQQQRQNSSLSEKASRNLFGRKMTVKDVVDILKNGDSEERKQLRKIFENSSLKNISNPEVLVRAGFSETDPAVVKAMKETEIKKGSASLAFIDILEHFYDKLNLDGRKVFEGLKFDEIHIADTGSFYTTSGIRNLTKGSVKSIGSIFPISMFHINDFIHNSETPDLYLTKPSDIDENLARALGKSDFRVDDTVLKVGDRVFVKDRNSLKEIKELKGQLSLVSGEVGVAHNIGRKNVGIDDAKDWSDVNKVVRWLGIEASLGKTSERYGHNANIYAGFDSESIAYLKDSVEKLKKDPKNYIAQEAITGLTRFQSFIERTTYGFDAKTAETLYNALENTDTESKRFLENIIRLEGLGETDKVIDQLLKVGSLKDRSYRNPGLSQLIQAYAKNPARTRRQLRQSADPYRRSIGKVRYQTFEEVLQKELSEEFLLRFNDEIRRSGEGNSITSVFDFLKRHLNNDIKSQDLAAKTFYNHYLGLPLLKDSEVEEVTLEAFERVVSGLEHLSQKTNEDSKSIISGITQLVRNNDLKGESHRELVKDQINRVSSQYIHLHKGYDSKEIIKQINQGHINKAIDMGLRNIQDRSTAFSMAAGHLLYRINTTLNEFDDIELTGLSLRNLGINLKVGLKAQDALGAKNVAKNLMLKRVLPVAAVFTALDFIDDVSKSTTGTGLYEAGASGMGWGMLGIKKATGALGLDETINNVISDNAIFQYFSGFTGKSEAHWKTYEEQKKEYEKGYDAVRKARFWTFGSSNEFRGGRISYWKPNYLRQLQSNYEMESLYNGDFWTKWSPMRLLDPYYLENLHSEDRPYPVSGSLFADNTPWGIVLNPTIGELIKPKRLLHTDRLNEDGVDVKALIYHMNSQIRDKAENNLFFVQNGKLRSVIFEAYNAPTYSERLVSINTGQDENGIQVNDYRQYNGSIPIQDSSYNASVNTSIDNIDNLGFNISDRIAIESAKGNVVAKALNIANSSSLNIIRATNRQIFAKAGYDQSQGMIIENKLQNERSSVEQLLEDSETISELINSGSTNDYIHQLSVSTRMLSGLYGWMLSSATGFGGNNQDRIATSADITSTSRAFWDAGYGGLGGGVMEIVRRVIPEYRRFQTINPLMNTMPDWIPERYRLGDPMTAVPNGEMRMPGRGYESLNQLHPDMFGQYGAFDRFKILADIAPYSPEYKFWKKVASKTIKDPDLIEEMNDIKERVREQNKQHDFMPYKYVGRDVNYNKAYVTEVLANGKFKVFGSDQVFKLSGVKILPNQQEKSEDVFKRYLTPGQEIVMVTDVNQAYAQNKDSEMTVNAGILLNGESISQMMLKAGDADIRKNDASASAYMTNHGGIVNTLNRVSEAFMHADIPILHNRWFRANDALEDYLDDYVYGASFQSWDDVIDTFFVPTLRKAAGSTFWTGAGILTDIVYNNASGRGNYNMIRNFVNDHVYTEKIFEKSSSPWLKNTSMVWLSRIHKFSDRGYLMGDLTFKMLKFGQSNQATWSYKGGRAGSALSLAFSAALAPENAAVSLMSWSRLGYLSADIISKRFRKQLTLAGAAIGALRWAGTVNVLGNLTGDDYRLTDEAKEIRSRMGLTDKISNIIDDSVEERFRNNVYIPESVRERWKMQEYFDRLTYLKYMGLFEAAAEKALEKEDTDIKSIIMLQNEEYSRIKIAKKEIKEQLAELDGDQSQETLRLRELLKERYRSLAPIRVPLSGGEYAKSAILYYNAAKATMYGLDENSSMADVIRALPKTDREYFIEFLKEKDPEKRREILRYVSPQIQKALKMFWYGEYTKQQSMEDYFSDNTLPAPSWAGWNPQIDLADVQAKVIKNEAMVASDFGVYASQYREPEVINAPELNYSEMSDGYIMNAMKLQAILSGYGLSDVNVSVEPQEDSSLQVIANIGRVVKYNVSKSIENFFGGSM